ncbi:hypothetical protein IL306_014279 [Fusarium sp. DS 682]|nr:hypothetical protein IL306_014279 [Fusarium sp. DS 682]
MSLPSVVTLINDLHGKTCDQVTSYQKEVVTLALESSRGGSCFRDQEFLILQPLFKALTIILLEDDFNVRVTDMGKLPVLITLTGRENGISEKLSFKSISHHVTEFISDAAVRVPLDIAIDFIVSQNQREIAAFGLQPDPWKSTMGLRDGMDLGPISKASFVRSLGGGDEPIEGPSSTWVDTAIYTGWAKASAEEDETVYKYWEKRERWTMLRHVAGVSLDWVIPRRRNSI